MPDVLILGGTRNLGHITALELLERGHRVTILNRGQTPDELPPQVERLRADRGNPDEMRNAVQGRSFDLVFDATTYTGADARQAVDIFTGNAQRYVFVSSGQVYLVREGVSRPFREEDYAGPTITAPDRQSADYPSWLYGVDKRDAEGVFMSAREASRFPVTTLRLPMVASERDHYGRIQAYIARILDGGPLLVPSGARLPLRHVYAADVARLIAAVASAVNVSFDDYNLSYGSSIPLLDFLAILSRAAGRTPDIIEASRDALVARGLLPDCSPFSGKWMSELDNSRSLADLGSLGLSYTSPEVYLPRIVNDYVTRWKANNLVPEGYTQRGKEIAFASTLR
ncbi:MAG TPA: NAD-dependent epimerase/dehydratase family protein [Gemmatimonadaceae bacterium]|nr:NAD-dependent epimerase/dehydratase family protein [Gemmatimonadaceae bacterium]